MLRLTNLAWDLLANRQLLNTSSIHKRVTFDVHWEGEGGGGSLFKERDYKYTFFLLTFSSLTNIRSSF